MPTPPSINKMRKAAQVFIEGGYYSPSPSMFVYSQPVDPRAGQDTPAAPQSTAVFIIGTAAVLQRGAYTPNFVSYPLGSFIPTTMDSDHFLFTSPLLSVRNEATILLGVLRFLTTSAFTIRRFPLHDGRLFYTLTTREDLYLPGTGYECPLDYDLNRIPI